MKHYSPAGRANHGRPLKRLLVTWDWNGSTSGPTSLQIHDDDDDDDYMWQTDTHCCIRIASNTVTERSFIYVTCIELWNYKTFHEVTWSY
jgi:hypothetical protein